MKSCHIWDFAWKGNLKDFFIFPHVLRYMVGKIRHISKNLIFFLNLLEGGMAWNMCAKKLMCYPNQSRKRSQLFTHFGVMFYLEKKVLQRKKIIHSTVFTYYVKGCRVGGFRWKNGGLNFPFQRRAVAEIVYSVAENDLDGWQSCWRH